MIYYSSVNLILHRDVSVAAFGCAFLVYQRVAWPLAVAHPESEIECQRVSRFIVSRLQPRWRRIRNFVRFVRFPPYVTHDSSLSPHGAVVSAILTMDRGDLAVDDPWQVFNAMHCTHYWGMRSIQMEGFPVVGPYFSPSPTSPRRGL